MDDLGMVWGHLGMVLGMVWGHLGMVWGWFGCDFECDFSIQNLIVVWIQFFQNLLKSLVFTIVFVHYIILICV